MLPPSGAVSGFVISDANGNGIADPGETGISGVSVSLVQGAIPVTTTTSPSGQYTFGNLAAGAYGISYQVPSGYVNTGSTSLGIVLSNAQTLSGPVFLAQLRNASVSGTVINDLNGNSVVDPGEPGIAGVPVTLTDSGASFGVMFGRSIAGVTQSTTTDANGNYTFTNLAQGIFTVGDTTPAGFVATTPTSIRVVLGATQSGGGSFLAQQRNAVISGSVVNDLNGNGVHDAGEPGLTGIPVVLSGPGGVVSMVSGAGGAYSFSGLTAGAYTVSYTPPLGFANIGVNPLAFAITAGQGSAVHDFFAEQKTASIAGVVISDANGNGVLDAPEVGLSGAVVTLHQGATSLTQTTGAGGNYAFANLVAGNYTLNYAPPAGFVNTGVRPLAAVLSAGGVITGRDFFAQQRNAVINGSVLNSDTGAGLSGVAVQLVSSGVPMMATTTNGSGAYHFSGLAAGVYHVDYTVPTGFTNVGTAPLNVTLAAGQVRNGVDFFARHLGSISGTLTSADCTDCTGSPIGGVTVQLFDGSNKLFTTTQTASDGSYTLQGIPGGSWTVDYIVPAHHIALSTRPLPASLATGQALTGINFTLERLGTLTGFACDTTSSGSTPTPTPSSGNCGNTGFPGIQGATITLTQGSLTYTATTRADGSFRVVDVLPNSYSVSFTSPSSANYCSVSPQNVFVQHGSTLPSPFLTPQCT